MTQQAQASSIDLSLDIGEIKAQIEEESLMPAELVVSEYRYITFDDDQGNPSGRDVWTLDWRRLDIDEGEYTRRTSHNLPDPNKQTPVNNRKELSYVKQVECFMALGIEGKLPQHFLGQKHWIRESTLGRGQYAKNWWKSEAIYVEGQTYEEAMGLEPKAENMNPPSNSSAPATTQEIVITEDSPYGKVLELIDGKTHRQAIAAIEKDEDLADNEEIQSGAKSGALFESLENQGIIREVDNKWERTDS